VLLSLAKSISMRS